MITGTQSRTSETDDSRQATLRGKYRRIRRHSDRIVVDLEAEDFVIQSMPDVSPLRWHLAHTTWFFETFVLKQFADYSTVCDQYEYLFNSYYDSVGDQFPRDRRGLLSRPTVAEILEYRSVIDERIDELFGDEEKWTRELLDIVELGLHHEQQHQELMLTDLKHVFSCNPLFPAHADGELEFVAPAKQNWIGFPEGLHEIGHKGESFAFDNESPRHRVFVEPFELSSRLVTNGEYLEFIEDGGYQRSDHWLSLGWSHVKQHGWQCPLYWSLRDGQRYEYTLGGLRNLEPSQPVTHVSYFEADAYARWAGARLATEAEWEVASAEHQVNGMFAEDYFDSRAPVHPTHGGHCGDLRSMFGSTWQWTSSSYSPYPGYRPPSGALGEYNGKFMCNQYVLRGGSCATSRDHVRRTYRNFFPADARWQFTGIRLARS